MVSNTGKGHTKEEKLAAFSRLLDVQDRLRLQCPWDKSRHSRVFVRIRSRRLLSFVTP